MLAKLLELAGLKRPQQTPQLPPFYQVYQPSLSLHLLDSRGLICHEHKFAYFRIPKAANSTIVASLFHADTSQAITSLSELQEIKDNYYDLPSSLSFEQVNEFQNTYFKFTFVRNPYTRVISAYQDKILSNAAFQRNLVENFLGKSVNSEISFDEFLTYLENGGINDNAHWARQCDLLPFSLRDFDFIGRVENLIDDLDHVLTRIFGNQKPIISIRPHATNASTLAKEIINISSKTRIYKLYHSDFDQFEYLLQ